MGTTKTASYPPESLTLAALAKALGHPARVAILRHLASLQGCQCGELVSLLPLSQSTVSQHLLALKEAGLIQGEVSGPATCYCIRPDALLLLRNLLDELLNQPAACTPASCC